MGKIVALVIGLGLAAGCGSSTLGGGGGPDGAAPPSNGCAALGACGCLAASDRCTARTEACYCPTECAPEIVCVCGGGQFLACEDKPQTTTEPYCTSQLARVQQACAAQPFIGGIDSLCSAPNAMCLGTCLANLGSCSEIDCRFCTACDCAPPVTASPFAACLESCGPLR